MKKNLGDIFYLKLEKRKLIFPNSEPHQCFLKKKCFIENSNFQN